MRCGRSGFAPVSVPYGTAESRSASRLLDDYAARVQALLFLWGSAPDGLLLRLAESGKLKDPEILKGQVARMLRNPKSFDFVQSFVEQWLRTRDLARALQPDAELFPEWNDAELQGDIRNQPVLFFREILANDLSMPESARFEVDHRDEKAAEVCTD